MKEFAHRVASAVAPVFGVSIAISVLVAADVPFPPSLEFGAWAQWAVFAAVVHASVAICMYAADRVFGGPRSTADRSANHPA